MEHPHQKSEDRTEIPADIIPDILLRLPTKDFVRSSCVCKLWRSIVADPSFRKLHVAHHHAAAASSKPEVLLVTETREPGRSAEASVFNLSSNKAMCQVEIPSGYHLAGVCNGLLCFTLDHDQAPAVVCNPITGDTLQLPKPPPLPAGDQLSHLFVLGFSPPTKEYKMFRLSFASRDETNQIAVYTLGGGGGGWRQCSYPSRFHPVTSTAPVHIDGNIFVPTVGLTDSGAKAARMLVLDVATETRRSYRIPYNFDGYHESWNEMLADGFELNGQMCLVVNVGFYPHPRKKAQFWVMKLPGDEGKHEGKDDDDKMWDLRYSFFLDGPFFFDGFDLNGQMCLVVNVGFYPPQSRSKIQFWVMKPPSELKGNEQEDDKLYWDLRYSFCYDDPFVISRPRGAWIDHTQTLCYRFAKFVYKYDTRGYSSSSNIDSLSFDKRVDLPDAPWYPPLSSDRLEFCRWNICGGYRSSLLCPLIFALPPSQDEKGKKRP